MFLNTESKYTWAPKQVFSQPSEGLPGENPRNAGEVEEGREQPGFLFKYASKSKCKYWNLLSQYIDGLGHLASKGRSRFIEKYQQYAQSWGQVQWFGSFWLFETVESPKYKRDFLYERYWDRGNCREDSRIFGKCGKKCNHSLAR